MNGFGEFCAEGWVWSDTVRRETTKAYYTFTTVARAEKLGLSAKDFLARHDSYHFFEPLGDLIKTGPTGTNVMDIRVLLVG